MIEIIEVLKHEHRNIEKLLQVLERELSIFDRGDRPDYEVVLAMINYFIDYPASCHHPKEDCREVRGARSRCSGDHR